MESLTRGSGVCVLKDWLGLLSDDAVRVQESEVKDPGSPPNINDASPGKSGGGPAAWLDHPELDIPQHGEVFAERSG